MCSQAVNLIPKYGEDWIKSVALDVKYWKWRKNTEIRLQRMRVKYFRFQAQTNSALEITSAICVPNLVKIGEKLRPPALTKEIILLLHKSVAAYAHWINLFWL